VIHCDHCEYVCNYRPHARIGDTFMLRGQLDGTVREVFDKDFSATMRGGSTEEQRNFPLQDVSPKERDLIVPDANFRYCRGYHDSVSGNRTHNSLLRFRREATGSIPPCA